MPNKQLEWDVAEVLEYDYTYQHIPSTDANSTVDKLFALRVRSCSGYFNNNPFLAKPSNINMKQIPLVGEFVLIYRTFNQESNGRGRWRESWYYVTSIDVQSSIHENMLPGLSDGVSQEELEKTKPGKTFEKKTNGISPLQPYEGDLLVEGRFGNSMRFGSTISTKYPANYYHKKPQWSNGATRSGDPIIILSNGRTNYPDKEFVVENIEQDASSLYLTTNQIIDNLTLTNELTNHPDRFIGSQFIGIADRVILRAKKDLAVIDAEEGIILNTDGTVKLGNDDADEPIVHGHVLKKVLDLLIQVLTQGTIGAAGPGTMIASAQLVQATNLLTELNSNNYFIKK
jgi:hypothetical protein